MSLTNLTHAEYILLAYGATGLVLALLLVQSWLSYRAACRALVDAGLADEKTAS